MIIGFLCWVQETYDDCVVFIKLLLKTLIPEIFVKIGVINFLPEASLFFFLIVLLFYYVLRYRIIYYKLKKELPKNLLSSMSNMVMLVFFLTGTLIVFSPEYFSLELLNFQNVYVTSAYISFSKVFVLVFYIIFLIVLKSAPERKTTTFMEYPIVVGFSGLFAITLLSSNDVLVTLLCLEVLTACGVVILLFNDATSLTVEVCLKYFLVNSLGMLILAFGFSGLYGVCGTLCISTMSQFVSWQCYTDYETFAGDLFIIAYACVFIGFLIKLGVAPFHLWLLDVYSNSRFLALYYLSVVSKFTLYCIFIRWLTFVFFLMAKETSALLMVFCMLSMFLGASGGYKQKIFKRMLAYSSVYNIGLILSCVALNDFAGFLASYLYILIYGFSLALVILCYVSIRKRNSRIFLVSLPSFAGLAHSHKFCALGLALGFFSLMGIPPLFGFFVKYLLLDVFRSFGDTFFILFIIIASIVVASYYLRLIKAIFFEGAQQAHFDSMEARAKFKSYLIWVCFLVLLLLVPLELWFLVEPLLFDVIESLVSIF